MIDLINTLAKNPEVLVFFGVFGVIQFATFWLSTRHSSGIIDDYKSSSDNLASIYKDSSKESNQIFKQLIETIQEQKTESALTRRVIEKNTDALSSMPNLKDSVEAVSTRLCSVETALTNLLNEINACKTLFPDNERLITVLDSVEKLLRTASNGASINTNHDPVGQSGGSPGN